MKLKFIADGQKLSQKGENFVVADSKNYLTAKFWFSQEWRNMQKSAIFKSADSAYTVMLSENCCKVPHEVSGADFCVSVFGTDGESRITTNEVIVLVYEGGYVEGEIPGEPTATVYEQFLAQTTEALQTANDAMAALEGKADVSMVEVKADSEALLSHTDNLQNPHSVTKEQLGLGNVDNTTDKDKPVSDAVAAQLLQKASVSEVESVRAEAEGAKQTANTTAGGLNQLNKDYLAYVKSNDATVNAINDTIAELDARHQSDIAAVSEQCDANSTNISMLTETVGDIEAALDSIIAIQNSLTGGDSV